MKTMRNRLTLILVLTIFIACILPGVSASADYIGEYTKGRDFYYEIYNGNIEVNSVMPWAGSLPAGVVLFAEGGTVYLTGAPLETGNFSATYTVETVEGALNIEVSMSVVDAPVATQAPAYTGGNIVITKNPTGEQVEAGGMAKFVAKAQNATRIVWRLVSPDASDTVWCSKANEYFPGLEVSGLGTDTLVLNRIPRDLNGWYVEAQFWIGDAVHVESSGAKIVIVDSEGRPINAQPAQPTFTPAPQPSAPVVVGGEQTSFDLPIDDGSKTANIVIQPQNWELKPGESYTLSVVATSPNNGTLSYQWYSAATDNRNAALPISGASDASYTVNQTEGTAYYWVAIWNSKDGARSQAVYSDAAEVSVVVPATPTPVPTPAPTPVPTPEPRGIGGPNIARLVPFLVIGVLALAALIGVVIYMRADAKREAEYEYDDEEPDSKK